MIQMQDFCATAFLLGSSKYRFEKCNKVLQHCVISQEYGIVAFVRDILYGFKGVVCAS